MQTRKRKENDLPDIVVVQAALVCEGLLLITAFVFSVLFDIPIVATFTSQILLIGLAISVPLVVGNITFSRYALARPLKFPTFARFFREMVAPLCAELPLVAAFAVAVLSGLCEELFFRGVMQVYLSESLGLVGSLIVTNALFAVVHFLGRLKDFWRLLPFYFLCGSYFSLITIYCADLTPSIVAHAINNFVAVLYVRRT